MSRLEKKCLIASATMHSALLALLFISPAFVPPKREPDLPVLTFFPTRLTDDPSYGGGSPSTAPPSQPAAAPTQTPKAELVPLREPEPVRPLPEPSRKSENEKAPTKPKPKPSPDTAAKQKSPTETPAKKRQEIVPSFKKSSDNPKAMAAAKAKAEADARAEQARYLERMNRLSDQLSKGLSASTGIEMPGPGGGEAYANYGQVVKSMYFNAWQPPGDLSDDSAVVEADVVILRDGKVKSAAIVKPSRIPALNDSVKQALNLPYIAPFPPDAKDSSRTFHLYFNPKLKKRPFG